ncbi:hypothetical protein LUZ60_014194 [Juncus effusus]|nr:hypothetical protein LUZ60_014194 [Juncus effusus]
MAAASSSSSPPPPPASLSGAPPPDSENPKIHLLKQIRDHEVALSELNSLRPDRVVYQKNGNIFFKKNIKSAITAEQKQLDLSKAQLEKLSSLN